MMLLTLQKPPRRSTAKLLRWSANLLALAGCGALAWCGAVLVQAHFYQEWASHYLTATAGGSESLHSNSVLPPVPGTLIGWVDIPRIDVTSAVLEGTDGPTLRLGVGHIEETALPGALGNIVLAGHRDTFFRKLREIHRSDQIVLTTAKGTYKYSVESTSVVEPDGIEVLSFLGRPTLTLVTCYPFDFLGPAPIGLSFWRTGWMVSDRSRDMA